MLLFATVCCWGCTCGSAWNAQLAPWNAQLLPHNADARLAAPTLAGFFSPLYNYLFGFHVFGLGFLTTLLFVFGVGGALPLPLLLGSCCWVAAVGSCCRGSGKFASVVHPNLSMHLIAPVACCHFAPAVFTSTWLGSLTIGTGEYIIKRVPLVQHIYSAAKQVRLGLTSARFALFSLCCSAGPMLL